MSTTLLTTSRYNSTLFILSLNLSLLSAASAYPLLGESMLFGALRFWVAISSIATFFISWEGFLRPLVGTG